ncbi:hypothetical protein L9F63_005415, partial [Diploptera punctata]
KIRNTEAVEINPASRVNAIVCKKDIEIMFFAINRAVFSNVLLFLSHSIPNLLFFTTSQLLWSIVVSLTWFMTGLGNCIDLGRSEVLGSPIFSCREFKQPYNVLNLKLIPLQHM